MDKTIKNFIADFVGLTMVCGMWYLGGKLSGTAQLMKETNAELEKHNLEVSTVTLDPIWKLRSKKPVKVSLVKKN